MSVVCLIFISLAFSAEWAFSYFGLSCFEQLVFHLKVPLEGTNTEFIKDWFKMCFFKGLLCTAALEAVLFFVPDAMGSTARWSVIVLCIIYGLHKIGFFEYVCNQFKTTDLYEKYYVDAGSIHMEFPEKKRNLIILNIESLENTYASQKLGGNSIDNLIEECTNLAQEGISFSHQDKLGGAYVVTGTGWTTGGLTAQSSGVPLTIPWTAPSFTEKAPFLEGITSLYDILKKEGYEQELLIGSEAVFGGRKFYYDTHGQVRIYDYNTARAEGKIPEDYRVFWGFEDRKLFSIAKEELTRLSQKEEPFCFTMLSVDMHHPYGYCDEQCKHEYPERLSNVIRSDSKMIGEFIDWLKQQDFYENTTILITGDHISMAAEYIRKTFEKNYLRTVFNAWLNAAVQPEKMKHRTFTTLDYFPSLLAALGVKMESDRLGLGTNLFSKTKTVAEEIGLDQLNQELKKQSGFYRTHILKKIESGRENKFQKP